MIKRSVTISAVCLFFFTVVLLPMEAMARPPLFTIDPIDDQTFQTNSVFRYQATYTVEDPVCWDGGISFDLTQAPLGMTITRSGLIEWRRIRHDQVGQTFQVEVHATAPTPPGNPCYGHPGQDFESFSITVDPPPAVCGDHRCTIGETHALCPVDCTDGGSAEANACAAHVVDKFNALSARGDTFTTFDITFKEPPIFPDGAFENSLAFIAEHDLSPCHTQGIARIGNRGLAQTINRGAGSNSPFINGCKEADELEPHHGAELYIYGMWSESPNNVGPWLGGQTDGIVSAHVLIDNEYVHAGGIQNIGNYLVVGSDPNGGGVSRVRIYDVSDLHDPQIVGGFERSNGRAEAVGVVREESDSYLIAVGSQQSQHIDFYRSQGTSLETTAWELVASYDFDTQGLDPNSIGSNHDHDRNYNSINLIKECGTNRLYLAGFANTGPKGGAVNNFTGSGDNWVELHEVNLGGPFILKRVGVKRFEYPGRAVSFSAGATIYIRPDNGEPIVYGSSHYGGYAQGAFPETYIGEWADVSALPPANFSEEEFGSEHCEGPNMKCQVMRIALSMVPVELTVLSGGGFSGNPTEVSHRCESPDAVEVYINDRDPNTNKTRWSSPDHCLLAGGSVPLSPGTTYDLRSVSIVGGTTIPFILGTRLSSVAFWPFDGDAVDLSGNANNGIVHGEVTDDAGKFGSALRFDGQSSYVELPNDPSLEFGGSFTLETWLAPELQSGEVAQIFMRGTDGPDSANNGWGIGLTAFNVDVAGTHHEGYTASIILKNPALAYPAENFSIVNTSQDTSSGAWHHVAVVWDRGNTALTLYVDGQSVASRNDLLDQPLRTSQGASHIGKHFDPNHSPDYYRGKIDQTLIWDWALSPTDIAEHAALGEPSEPSCKSPGQICTSGSECCSGTCQSAGIGGLLICK